MIKTETCKALEMLENSCVIEVHENLLHNWSLDSLDCDGGEIVFECSYTDSHSYIYEFSFSKDALMEAVIKDNNIIMKDDTGEEVEVGCYSLTPVV